MQLGGRHASPRGVHGDPDDPLRGKAMAAGAGIAVTILALGLLVWMAVDVDSDGASTYAEFGHGTSPMQGDSDGDGVADGWEIEHGYDALSAASSPSIDPDLPGITDDSISDIEECSVQDLLEGDCDDESASEEGAETQAPSVQEQPPSGGKGTTGSLVIGGATTLVAGISARLISQAILSRH